MTTTPSTEAALAFLDNNGVSHEFTEAQANAIAELVEEARAAGRAEAQAIIDIVKRHTHQGLWAMTRHAGPTPEQDCHLCRALVAAGVLTLDEIGASTRKALLVLKRRARNIARQAEVARTAAVDQGVQTWEARA